MPTYHVTHRATRETYELEAPYAQDACEALGGMVGDCHVHLVREAPFTDLSARPRRVTPPRDAGDLRGTVTGQ